jgi:beta-lactamase regulating signal transducer with metallopeptidase domain/HEAT repeat protein
MNALADFLNFCGAHFTPIAKALLFQTAVVALAISLIDLVFGRRIRPVLLYSLWMLVFIKLLIPIHFSLPTGLQLFSREERQVNIASISNRPGLPRPRSASASHVPTGAASADVLPSGPTSLRTTTARRSSLPAIPVPSSPVRLTVSGWLFALWASGVALLGTFLISRTRRLSKLRRTSTLSSPELVTLLRDGAAQLQTRRIPELRLTPEQISPTIFGVFHPVIVLPKGLVASLSEADLRVILLHELLHLKRGDLLWQTFQSVLTMLHFYNPFVWVASRRIALIREEAVDRSVIHSGNSDPAAYAQTLVNVSRGCRELSWAGCLSIIEKRRQLRTRVERIMATRAEADDRFGIVGLATLIAISAVLLPLAKADVGKVYHVEGDRMKSFPTIPLPLAKLSTQQLFGYYRAPGEFMSRQQAALVNELLGRKDAPEFLFEIIRKPAVTNAEVVERSNAICLAGKLGERGRRAVPLLAHLVDADVVTRVAAIQALGRLGPVASDAVQALVGSPMEYDPVRTMSTLLQIAPQSEKVQVRISQALTNSSPEELTRLNLLMHLDGDSAVLRSEHVRAALRTLSSHHSDDIRHRALYLLHLIEPRTYAKPPQMVTTPPPLRSLDELIEKLNKNPNDDDVRQLNDLARAGTNITAALEVLTKLLKTSLDAQPLDKPFAVRAIRNYPSATRTIPSPLSVLNAFAWIGPTAEPAVPLLLTALKADDVNVYRMAIQALGATGPAAMAAKPSLLLALKDTDPAIRWTAANALRKIDPSELARCLPVLLEVSTAFSPGARVYQIRALADLGPEAATILPSLRPLLSETDPVRFAAMEVIASADPKEGSRFLPEVKAEFQNPESPNRIGAARVLARLSQGDPKLLDDLKKHLNDPDEALQKVVRETLAKASGG